MKEELSWQLDTRKQASFRRRLFVFVGILIAIGLFIGIGYLWLESSIQSPVADNMEDFAEIVVEEGMGVEEITDSLEKQGVIKSTVPFKYYVWSEKLKNEFKAGTFSVSPGMTVPQLVSVLTSDLSGEVEMLVPEGWRIEQIAMEAGESFGTTGLGVPLPSDYRKQIEVDFLEAADQKDYGYDWLSEIPEDNDLEGFLFPDTYRYYRQADMRDVVAKMLENFDTKVDTGRRQALADRGWDLYEAVTLASIVQKEAREEDMSAVAGIFIARLASGQKLESDATVNFVTKKNALQPTLDDVRTDSLYNTYKYAGLPPGPICNPGLAAIDAVIDPDITSYRYFLNTPEGDTIFSETYEEHLENKAKYLD